MLSYSGLASLAILPMTEGPRLWSSFCLPSVSLADLDRVGLPS